MNLLPGVTRIIADGVVGTSGRAIRVYSLHLCAASGTAASAIIRLGTTTGGTAYAQINAGASISSTINFAGGMLFPTGCYCDVTFTSGDYITIVYAEQV